MNYKYFLSKAILVFLILFSFPLHGKMFKESYVEFSIGYDWICKSFGVDWVCHHYLQKGVKPALMLITAKEGISSDNLSVYEQAFNEDQTTYSKKIYVKKIMVNRHTWVESFYQDNILNGVVSRYVATVCCEKIRAKIHILVGFHAYKENYEKYSREFLRSIKSLRLGENLQETLEQIRRQTDQQKKDMLSYIEQILFEADEEDDLPILEDKKHFGILSKLSFFGFILIIFATVFYFFYYKKRKTIRKRSSRSRRKRRRQHKHQQKPRI